MGYDELSRINPGVVMVRAPAFGLTGPWRERPGYAVTMEAVAGMTWLTGYADGDPVAPSNPGDPLAGAHATLALLIALEHRRRTGRGMLVEAPMIGALLNVASEQVVEHSKYGRLIERSGNRGPSAIPQNLYLSADLDDQGRQDRWVAIAVENDEQWSGLCAALADEEESTDLESLATRGARAAAHDQIDSRLSAWCAGRSSTDIVEALWSHRVPVGIVMLPHEQD